MRRPDYLVIGVQKGGTTSLYRYLIAHPQVDPAEDKQLHFFDRTPTLPLTEYEARFPDGLGITGEATPYYIYHPACARRVHAAYPKVKIIALLRNPVERTWSHYHHELTKGAETLSFEEALQAEDERLSGEEVRLLSDPTYLSYNHVHYSYRARSRYADQLSPWLDLFPRTQCLFLSSESLFTDAVAIMNRIANFLGLAPFPSIIDLGKTYNANSKKPDLTPERRKLLADYFSLHNRRLFDLIGQDFDWEAGA